MKTTRTTTTKTTNKPPDHHNNIQLFGLSAAVSVKRKEIRNLEALFRNLKSVILKFSY